MTLPNTSTTSSSSSTTTHTTVYLPNILLDENNYPTWLFRMESFLRGQNLFGFVDGSTPCPPQLVLAADGVTSITSLEYIAWKTQDQSVINMMGQTLSPVAMTCAVGSKSAKQMWDNLKLKFAAPNRQNILQLKSNLQNLRKGSDDIETYLDKVKIARDALETVGVTIDDEDIVVTVLRGLPAEFAAIKTVIRAQFVSCSLGELKTLLKAAEVDIENESQCSAPLTAMLAKNGPVSSQLTTGSSSATNASFQSAASSSTYSPPLVASQAAFQNIQPVMSSQVPYQTVQGPALPPTVTAPTHFTSQAVTSLVPPGFSSQPLTHIPLQHQSSYMPIPAMPYGFSAFNPYTISDNAFGMTGFLAAGRGNGARFPNNMGNRFPNTGLRQGGQTATFNPTGFGFNNNGGNNASSSNIPRGNFNNNFNNNNSLVCQLCNRVGHGARTCRSLSNFQDNASNVIGCQYCGKKNHTADRCYFVIGFPGQQQQTEELEASAMLAAASNAPQFWLADTGATNHMTSNPQLLSNLVQYPAADAVQIGQGVGQDSIPRTE